MNRISLSVFKRLDVCLLMVLSAIACVPTFRSAITSLNDAGTMLPAPSTGVVGTVAHEATHQERTFLMGTSTYNTSQALMIQLVGIGAPAETPVMLGQEIVRVAGGPPPYHYKIDYDQADTRPEGAYGVRAELAMDSRILIETPIEPVLLQTNAPTGVVLVLAAVGPQGSAGMPAGIERLARFAH